MHNLFSLWPEFTERYEASKASLETYRQKYAVFLKWLEGRNATSRAPVEMMEDVTRELAEEYARVVFKRKTTAKKDIDNLRRLWDVMLPDQDRNPWRIGLHLRTPPLPAPCNYRPLSLDEARRFIRAALDAAAHAATGDIIYERALPSSPSSSTIRPDARYTTGAGKFEDLADAAVFAWHYGMRMGSLAALSWKELATWRRGYFLHVPPKTRFTKPWPLEIPVVREAAQVIESRLAGRRNPTGPLFPDLAAEYRRSQPNLASSVKGLFKSAGICDTHKGRAQMHSFRASFITQMDEVGVPTGITDCITGHAPRTVHDRYSHARPQALRKWLDKAIPDLSV